MVHGMALPETVNFGNKRQTIENEKWLNKSVNRNAYKTKNRRKLHIACDDDGGDGEIRTHVRLLANWFRVFSTIMTFVVFSYRFQAILSAQNHSCIKVFWHSPLKKLDFSRGSNESQKWADFGSFVRIRVRNVRTMLEQHSIHRCLPPNKWQRCMLWKSMTLIGQKCRIFWLRNRCACFAIAANEQHSIIWKAESCRAFIRGRKPGATKSGKKIWWLL